MKVKDRIKEIRTVKASELIDNPDNFRKHGSKQRRILKRIFRTIGSVDVLKVIETKKGLMLIDGHERKDIIGRGRVKVAILDLTRKEARQILASFDPITEMAQTDEEKFAKMVEKLDSESKKTLEIAEIEEKETQGATKAARKAKKAIGKPQKKKKSPKYQEKSRWAIIIECESGEHQQELMDSFKKKKLKCKAVSA